MIIAMCSGQGRTFEAVARTLGPVVTDMICDKTDAPVLQRADALGVRAHLCVRNASVSRQDHEAAILEALQQCTPFSVIALLGYMRVLSSWFLEQVKARWPSVHIINLHPAPLSVYKGAHGLHTALAQRAPLWGISVHIVTPALDSGPLVAWRPLTVFPTDTLETLRERAHPLEVSAVLEALDILMHRSSSS